MKKVLAMLLFGIIPVLCIYTDENMQQSDPDIDAFITRDDESDKGDIAPKDTDIISEILPNGIFFGADFLLYTGYSPGLNYLPGDVMDLSQIQYADMVLVSMTSSLSIDVRFSPDLKLFSKLSVVFPDFSAEITELFCDFNILKTVYVRVGRQGISWGISPNYPFTNLIERIPVPQQENVKTADSIACKVDVPFGVGGLEMVAFSRTSFWDAPDKPEVDDIGLGAKFNLALQYFDFSIGGYYHKDVPLRFFYSLSTTLFGTVEAYTEALATTTLPSISDPVIDSWYFSGNIGFYVDFFNKALKINAEYYYCGETDNLTLKGADFSFFPGHNIALNTSLSLDGGRWTVYLQNRYNISQDTGYLIPMATLDVIPSITFSLAVPVTIGSITGGYFVQNTINNNRRVCVVFAVIVKGNI